MKSWKNKNNGFTCVELHYRDDPKKQTEEWKRKAAFGMDSRSWLTEMELSWETYAGEPVYGKEFTKETHVYNTRIEPNRDYPTLIRGWDFGGNHSCAVIQYYKGRVNILDEYANVGYNTRRIAREIKEDCTLKYGTDFRFIEAIDPSGAWEGKTSDGMACKDIMTELGMEIVPGIQDVSRRIDSVMKFLTTMSSGKPCLMVNPECPMTIAGFLGGYHYPEKIGKNVKVNKPEKNEYSHIHDAIQYVCTIVDQVGDAFYGEIDISDLGGYTFDF